MTDLTNIGVATDIAKYPAKLFVIMFEHKFFPVGPFESWEAADEYGMRVIEPTLCKGCNQWKVRPLTPPERDQPEN